MIVTHLSDGSLWSRQHFPDTTVLESPQQSLARATGAADWGSGSARLSLSRHSRVSSNPSYTGTTSTGRAAKSTAIGWGGLEGRQDGRLLDPARVHCLGRVLRAVFLRLMQITRCHVYLTYPVQLAKTVTDVLVNPGKYGVFGEQARATIKARYDLKIGCLTSV